MFVPEKLKLNKFKPVRVPSKGEFMARYGEIPINRYSGDEAIPGPERKTDNLAQVAEDMAAWDKVQQQQQKGEE